MDYSKKASFIRKQLSRVPEAQFEDDQVTIRCPFHDDHNPSLNVSLIRTEKVSVGGFACWSCQNGHGGWNKLAAKLGLEFWNPETSVDSAENVFGLLAQQMQRAAAIKPYEKPATEGLWVGSYRGLSQSFMRSVGAEKLWDMIYEEYRIFLPVLNLRKDLIGHIACRAEKDTCIPDKYKNLNSANFPSDRSWYLLPLIKDPRILVIVEGPYDALRLMSLGIPAIAVLGVKTLTEEKIIQLISVGCRKIVLALDGDLAGKNATSAFKLLFGKYNFDAADLKLPELNADGTKCDPGNCAVEIVSGLKDFVDQGLLGMGAA